jgi:hypothetical protein
MLQAVNDRKSSDQPRLAADQGVDGNSISNDHTSTTNSSGYQKPTLPAMKWNERTVEMMLAAQ